MMARSKSSGCWAIESRNVDRREASAHWFKAYLCDDGDGEIYGGDGGIARIEERREMDGNGRMRMEERDSGGGGDDDGMEARQPRPWKRASMMGFIMINFSRLCLSVLCWTIAGTTGRGR